MASKQSSPAILSTTESTRDSLAHVCIVEACYSYHLLGLLSHSAGCTVLKSAWPFAQEELVLLADKGTAE